MLEGDLRFPDSGSPIIYRDRDRDRNRLAHWNVSAGLLIHDPKIRSSHIHRFALHILLQYIVTFTQFILAF
jgi:hypothetical protein